MNGNHIYEFTRSIALLVGNREDYLQVRLFWLLVTCRGGQNTKPLQHKDVLAVLWWGLLLLEPRRLTSPRLAGSTVTN